MLTLRGVSLTKYCPFSSQRRIVSNETLESDVNAPAPLNLPFGKLFFGYRVIPYNRPSRRDGSDSDSAGPSNFPAFAGSGNTLSNRSNGSSKTPNAKGKGKEQEENASVAKNSEVSTWGKGQKLGDSRPATTDGPIGAGGARAPRGPVRGSTTTARPRSPTPDWGVDDDDDVIYIDSD